MSFARGSCVLLLLALTAGCSGAGGSRPAGAAPVSADTWAVVDGREIRRDDVERAYRRARQPTQTSSEDEALIAKLALLDEIIVQDILLAKAGALKIALTDAELDTAYAEARKNIPEEQFQQELGRRSLTAADMREGLRRELLTQKVLEREVESKVSVSDQDIADFFNANRAEFNRTEEAYRIAQIVVTPGRERQPVNRSGNDAATPQEAAAKVQMLMERLKGGADFGELAAAFSEDPDSAQRGGDLGFVPISALRQAPAALRDAIVKSEPGTVQVVSSGGGHTIVLLLAREAAGQRDPSMPEVRERISGVLRARRTELLRTAYLGAIRSDAVVVNHIAQRVVSAQGKMPTLAPTPPGAK